MPRSSRRSSSERLVIALGVVLALSGIARADAVQDYKQALARGAELFEQRDYPGARVAFEKAFAIHADPVLVFNIASTYRREGALERAVTEYRRYLSLSGEADSDRRTLALETIEGLEDLIERAAEREAEAAAEARAAADARARAVAAKRAEHAAAARRAERARAKRDAARRAALSRAENDPAPPRSRRGLRLGGIAVGAAGTASLGLALFDLARARDAQARLDDATAWNEREADLYETGAAASRRAAIAGAVGAGLVVTGITLYWFGNRGSSDRAVTVTPLVGDDGAGAVLRASF